MKQGTVVHTYNPSTMEVEEGGTQVQDQPGLQRKTLSENSNNKRN
jgi:hypothetical protein